MGKLINRIPGSCLLISSLPGSALRAQASQYQQAFSKLYLVNLISKDTPSIPYLSFSATEWDRGPGRESA